MPYPIVILAAGRSQRMQGRDKLLELVDGVALLRRCAQRACAASDQVIIALPPRPHARYEVLAGIDVTLLEVSDAHEGINASLRAGMAMVPAGASAAFLVLADMPDIAVDDFKTIAQAAEDTSQNLIWRGATEDGKAGHPILFAAELLPQFSTLSGDLGGREIIAQAGDKVQLVPLEGTRARTDLDTPQDWENWRKARP